MNLVHNVRRVWFRVLMFCTYEQWEPETYRMLGEIDHFPTQEEALDAGLITPEQAMRRWIDFWHENGSSLEEAQKHVRGAFHENCVLNKHGHLTVLIIEGLLTEDGQAFYSNKTVSDVRTEGVYNYNVDLGPLQPAQVEEPAPAPTTGSNSVLCELRAMMAEADAAVPVRHGRSTPNV